METRFKLLGHPVHPMLIVLPIALFATAVLFDIVYLLTDDATFATLAFWNIAIGIVGGLAAAIFGFVDWLGLPEESRARRIGLYHGVGNVVIVVLFAISWWLRTSDSAYAPDVVPFVLALIGVALALVTAWLGGELVYRLRVGVDPDANVDASNSVGQTGLTDAGMRGAQRSRGEASRPIR